MWLQSERHLAPYFEGKESKMAFVSIVKAQDLPDGERIVVELGELWVAVFNVGGRYYAIEDACTHDDGPLAEGELEGMEIACPRHGARFHLETGKATFPAVKPAARFAVRVEGEDVQVDIETRLA
jgi:3-phenylpropionate/trans-cinnamate dioxygenase ferredoxin subunit